MSSSGSFCCMQARKNLEFVRGTRDVDKEYNDLVEAAELAKQVLSHTHHEAADLLCASCKRSALLHIEALLH